jgi:capsular exopolysaccharide synthesis family protein
MRRSIMRRLSRSPDSGPARWTIHTSFEESFRMLRSSMLVALSDIEHPIVVVTSSKAYEGKTVVCTKLALSFAEAGKRVVLVDLDLRHPSAHRLLQTHNEFGMSDVLLGDRSLKESLQHLEVHDSAGQPRSLYFIGTGPPVQNPAELMGSGRAARALDGLSRQADIVLIDTPAVLPVADTLILGRFVSGAILVVETRGIALQAVQHAKDLLIRNQTRILGTVMNKFEPRRAGDPYSYYGYGYGYGSLPGEESMRPSGIDSGLVLTNGFGPHRNS